MTVQPDLWSAPPQRPVEDVHGHWRPTDPETSRMAAVTITGRSENLLLDLYRAHGGLTADEAAALLPRLYPPTLASALSRLASHELIEDSGARRASNRGRPAIVWRLKNPARESAPPERRQSGGGVSMSPQSASPPGDLA